MQIFADPNELSANSTLPKDVAGVATPLPGLEERTGADLLVSILDIPAVSDILLKRHCEYGQLVQHKRYNDLQSSIPDQRLPYSILKMREWSPFPTLLVEGTLLDIDGLAVVAKYDSYKELPQRMIEAKLVSEIEVIEKGRKGLHYNAVNAALWAFRYYGGYVDFLPKPENLLKWLEQQAEALQAIRDDKVTELMPRNQWRTLIGPTKVAWLASLFDGIGQKTAQAVFDKVAELTGNDNPSLYQAVAFVTDYNAAQISGITRERVRSWREFLGLRDEDETHITPSLYATLGMEWRLFDTGEVYWHSNGMQYHYRNDGPIKPEGVNTPYYLRDLLNDGEFTLTYSADGQQKQVTGELLNVLMERKFEYVLVRTGASSEAMESIRLDRITKVERKEK